MKVRVTLTVEVDNAEWAEHYGTGESNREVSADVKDWFLNYAFAGGAPIQDARLVK